MTSSPDGSFKRVASDASLSPLSWDYLNTDKLRTTLLVNLAGIMERMDEQILPALYNFIGLSFHATPSQLGTLTLCRALVQALSSPIGGLSGAQPNFLHACLHIAWWLLFSIMHAVMLNMRHDPSVNRVTLETHLLSIMAEVMQSCAHGLQPCMCFPTQSTVTRYLRLSLHIN